MPITIKRIEDDLYEVSTANSSTGEGWVPGHPIRGKQLVRELIDRGWHQQDVGDAFYEADPMWVEKLRDP